MNAGLPAEFLTREEFAGLLLVSVRTVDEWIADRRVAFFRKGRNVRISRDAAAAFILSGTVLARERLPVVPGNGAAEALRHLLGPVVREILEQKTKSETAEHAEVKP